MVCVPRKIVDWHYMKILHFWRGDGLLAVKWIQMIDQTIDPLFDMLIFFSARFLNRSKPLMGWSTWIGIYESRLACLKSWLGMVNVDWLGSKWSEIFLQIKFFILKVVPPNWLPFYSSSSLHTISSFSHFCLLQNAILHKMLKLGFWRFELIFLRKQFSLDATFFSLVLAICLSWYFGYHGLISFYHLYYVTFEDKSVRVLGLCIWN